MFVRAGYCSLSFVRFSDCSVLFCPWLSDDVEHLGERLCDDDVEVRVIVLPMSIVLRFCFFSV